MDATTRRRDRSFADRAAAGIASAVLAASGAAADPEVPPPSLAAPGDCAQPVRDLDTGPAHGALPASASRGVAGLPALHFAPIAAPDDSGAVLPLDLTRAAQPADVSGDWVGEVAEESASLVEGTADAGAAAIGQVGDAAGALVGGAAASAGSIGEIGDAGTAVIGGVGETTGALGDLGVTTGDALGDVGSAVDPLVDTTTDTLGATTGKLLE